MYLTKRDLIMTACAILALLVLAYLHGLLRGTRSTRNSWERSDKHRKEMTAYDWRDNQKCLDSKGHPSSQLSADDFVCPPGYTIPKVKTIGEMLRSNLFCCPEIYWRDPAAPERNVYFHRTVTFQHPR